MTLFDLKSSVHLSTLSVAAGELQGIPVPKRSPQDYETGMKWINVPAFCPS